MTQLIALLTIFLAVLLIYNNRKIQPSTLWLSLSMIVISIIQLAHYFAFVGTSTYWMAIFFMHPSPLYYLLGPFIFFYIRGILSDKTKLSWKDAWHFIPFMMLLIGMMPYVVKPWSFKLYVAEQMMQDVYYMVRVNDLLLYPPTINIVLRLITWFGYIGYCLYLVKRFQHHYPAQGRIPFNDARRILHFLIAFLTICLINVFSYTALMAEYLLGFHKTTQEFISTPWVIITNLGIASIPFLLILYPEILYGIPRSRKVALQDTLPERISDALIKNIDAGTKTVPQLLDVETEQTQVLEGDFEGMSTRILEVMEIQKPFLNPEFGPDDLARMLDIPKHHLYYCFNKILNTRFTRLRAEYRVRYAQELIDRGESSYKTLEAIGQESGFSNRISFNNSFREVTGMSPSDYLRKQNQ